MKLENNKIKKVEKLNELLFSLGWQPIPYKDYDLFMKKAKERLDQIKKDKIMGKKYGGGRTSSYIGEVIKRDYYGGNFE